MIRGGTPTVFVSSINRAIDFYTNVLGLKLKKRYGDHWAEVDAGDGLIIGLHPPSPNAAGPGTRGSIEIGLNVTRPIGEVCNELTGRGVTLRGPIQDDPNSGIKLAFFSDPDGNPLYLCEVPKW